MKRSAIGVVAILAMLAAVLAPAALAQPVVQTSTSLTKIFFEPDAGSAPFLNIINSSNTSLQIEVYIMTSREIFTAIGNAVNRGVKVQVILTPHPYNMESVAQSAYNELTSLGAQVRWAPARFTYDHAKFIIVDGARALVGTSNYTYGGTNESFEANVITTDPHLVNALEQVFTADWAGTPAGTAPRQYLVLSPNSESDLQWLIDNAHQSVVMVEEEVPEGKIFTALESAAKRGVNVQLIEPQSNVTRASGQYALASLAVAGVHVGTVKQPFVHAKMIITDGKYLFIGSENVSTTSMYDNREVGVILDNPDLVSQAMARVAALWKTITLVPAELPVPQLADLTQIATNSYNYIGKLVKVKGTVEAVFGPTAYFTAISGSQIAGVELWLGHVQNESPTLTPGQIVQVTGAVDVYNGQLEISAVAPPTVLSGTALLPVPFQPTLDKLGDYDGLIVLVKGTVENYGGEMSISDGTTRVNLLALTPLPPIMSTAVVYVEGVVVNQNGNYVIAPIRFYSAASYTPFERGAVKKNPALSDLRTSVKLYYNQTISTTGVVSAVLSDKTAYITSDGYGMRLYGEHGSIVPGDIVAVNGVLSSYDGSLEISVSAVKVTGHTTAPAPIVIKTGEAAKYPEMLVKATGTVSNVSGKNFDIDDGSGVLLVYMSTGTLPANGATTTVVGISVNYKGTYEISALPLSAATTATAPAQPAQAKSTIQIADLRANVDKYLKQAIAVTGVVAAVPSDRTAYIVANSAGIRLYGEHGSINPGDIVAVNGVLSSYDGSLEIDVTAVKVTGHTTAPAPIVIKTGEAAKYPEMLVKATGTVSNVSGKNFDIDDGSGVLLVYMSTGTLPANGATTTVVGISVNYKGTYEIYALPPVGTGS